MVLYKKLGGYFEGMEIRLKKPKKKDYAFAKMILTPLNGSSSLMLCRAQIS